MKRRKYETHIEFKDRVALATLSARRERFRKLSDKLSKERSRDEATSAEALANAPGPLNDRDVIDLVHAGIVKRV